jgi:MYXO-CTERM domain-containing protein
MKRAIVICAVGLSSFVATTARAYSYESVISDGCHEGLAKDALRAVRAAQPDACTAVAGSKEDDAMIGEAPFTIDSDLRDIAAFAFLVGIRDNDLKGRAPTDSTTLATIHGNPNGQREHCLRRHENDEPGGTKAVIDDCRGYIEELLDHALDAGIDEATSMPNINARTRAQVYLAFSGEVDAMLPIFWLYMGQALHVVQDSFTHMYRVGPGFEQITVALNWIDVVDGDYDERRDGPPHMSALDQCHNLDPYREARLGAARKASTDLLLAAVDPVSKAERKAKLRAILDNYFGYVPGCTFETRWCDAPENQYRPPTASCSVSETQSATEGGVAFLAVLGIFAGRRSRKLAAAAIIALAVCAPRTALAQKEEGPAKDPPASPPSVFSTSASAAIDHPGFVIAAGYRHRLGEGWMLGGDVEWNPWVSLESKTFQGGTLDVYATLIRRYRITNGVHLRTSAHLGASVLLFSMYGAPAGTFGPYAGLSLVGVEIKTGAHTRLIFDPADVALPVPHLNGAPLSYREYRLTLGFEIGG